MSASGPHGSAEGGKAARTDPSQPLLARPGPRRLVLLLGLALAGQGLLVVTRVLDHEAPLAVGFAILVLGLLLVALTLRGKASRHAVSVTRSGLVLGLGLVCIGGVVGYNVLRRSSFGVPELAIVAYGVALVLASRRLDRFGRVVAYSFPLVLAPLSLYALNAALAAGAGGTPLSLYIRHGLVVPLGGALALLGIDVMMLGDTVRLATPRGALFLTVGVVCAGLYAMVLFLGVFALFAWEQRTSGWRLAAYLALGLLGLHVANVVRLILLALVGYEWGGEALQTFHQHAGWVLFLAWAVLFWWLVLRRFERPRAALPP
ncbi:MAG TPA: exosortase/archaeosortase family protein [Candidatus Thermoplasmatota archaeon]|nr:exosortase/archaeosortase family protein [Candidatus Thermoplasmatota archaeon]